MTRLGTPYAVRLALLAMLFVFGVGAPSDAGQARERPAQVGAVEGAGQRAGAGRAGRPVPPARMDAQQLQAHIDALALVQAQRALNLTEDQQPGFASKLVRLQNVRRRLNMERRRLLNELRGLLEGATPKDEAIAEKLKAMNDLNRRGGEELIRAYDDLDTVLTPRQRGQFRLFEERIERQKLEMLAKIGG